MGDRICVMRDGLIMQVADPLTLFRQPENMFVAGFMGSPPMNLIRGRIIASGESFIFQENNPAGAGNGLRLEGPLLPDRGRRLSHFAEGNIVLGIRPENIAVHEVGGVTDYHTQLLEFAVRMLLDATSPSNYLASNPELLALTRAEQGQNLVRGFKHVVEDIGRTLKGGGPAGTEEFEVGKFGGIESRGVRIDVFQHDIKGQHTDADASKAVEDPLGGEALLELAVDFGEQRCGFGGILH